MPEKKTYEGGCHCGKVRYKVASELTPVIECNCSICSKRGHLLTFAPATEFELVSGQDAVTEYQFNKHIIHHLFCSTCGISSFNRGVAPNGTPTIAINVRCLDGVDIGSLQITPFDGKSK